MILAQKLGLTFNKVLVQVQYSGTQKAHGQPDHKSDVNVIAITMQTMLVLQNHLLSRGHKFVLL